MENLSGRENGRMANMSLENLERVSGGRLVLPPGSSVSGSTEITGADLDSRKVEEGGLFIASVGEKVDGHRFIGTVYEKGAVCVITEKTPEEVEREHGIPASVWGAYILVKDSLQALKDMAEFYRSTLHIPVIGITGSVGKTSTKEFIAAVLSVKFRVLKTEGNYNNEIGVPLTLLRIREYHEAAVVEMGISEFGEMRRLSRMARPNICVITNIGQSHLVSLKSRDGILKAKSEIFEYMDEDGEICLNGDDDKLARVTSVRGRIPHFYGMENPSEEVYLTDVRNLGLSGSHAVLHLKNNTDEEERVDIHVPLPGNHMVMNAAAAASVALRLNMGGEDIARGISTVPPVTGRSNLIRLSGYTLIDDCYNANPISMQAAIDLLDTADTPKVAILGDMLNLGEDTVQMHMGVGEYAARSKADRIICVGELGRYIYEGALKEKQPDQEILYFAEKKELMEALRQKPELLLGKGEPAILLKASHGMGFAELVEQFRKSSSIEP